MNAKAVLFKCPQTKGLYGVRIEERNNDWVRNAMELIRDRNRVTTI